MAATTAEPLFSVIVPTSGRATLRRTLRRLRNEDAEDIEVIVVSDGPQPVSASIAHAEAASWPAIRYHEGPLTRSWGNAQRMVGIGLARGRYLVFVDDDDLTRRGGFRSMRDAVGRHPNRVLMFRMKREGEKLWRHTEIARGNVGGVMIVVPNVPGKTGSWLTNDHYTSDFDFISECVALQGEPVWDSRVIVYADPAEWWQVAMWLRPRVKRWRDRAMIRTRVRRLARSLRSA